MKTLVLKEMWLLSHSERKGRHLQFHPKATIIKGPNSVGKSCIIKSIYNAFGAEPAILHPNWKNAKISTLISFMVDDTAYYLFRLGKCFTLFDADKKSINTYTSVTKELGPALADIFDFRLLLENKQLEAQIPPPAFLFLPFYIDQDAGWQTPWSSFTNLSQFNDWKKDVIYYHTGIRSNPYYVLRSQLRMVEQQLIDPESKLLALNQLHNNLSLNMNQIRFEIDINVFKDDIDQLLKKCENLRKFEERYQRELSQHEAERLRINAQIDVVSRIANELHCDYVFANDDIPETDIECPLCGQTYENSFQERFQIAQDEHQCRDLLSELQLEKQITIEKIAVTKKSLNNTIQEYTQIQELLVMKQGQVTLQLLIENEGKKEISKQVTNEISVLRNVILGLKTQQATINNRLRELESNKHKKAIENEYQFYLASFLRILNVNTIPESAYEKIEKVIRETGSDRPRAILAYAFAMLQTIHRNSSSTFCPIVIDSPRQQDLDEVNYEKELVFIRDKRPQETQLILGLVDDHKIDFGGNIIEINQRESGMIKEEYENVSNAINPFEQIAFDLGPLFK